MRFPPLMNLCRLDASLPTLYTYSCRYLNTRNVKCYLCVCVSKCN